MDVSKIDKMATCYLKSEMLPDGLMVFQTDWIELEFFTKAFFEIIGQLLAACPSGSSRKFTFCWAIRRLASPSFVKPLNGSTLGDALGKERGKIIVEGYCI